jgi:hypothetical protein
VDHEFVTEDFDITTQPPATGLKWTVENNPAGRRLEAATSLVYLNIVEGKWDSNAVFGVAFTNTSMIKDVYGQPLPASMAFTTSPPVGPEVISEGDDDDDGPSTGTIVGAVLGSVFGAGLIGLVIWLLRRLRRNMRVVGVKTKYEEVAQNSVKYEDFAPKDLQLPKYEDVPHNSVHLPPDGEVPQDRAAK